MVKIGVSECLLGVKCRYDGGHKKDAFLMETLSRYVDFIPFCPEAFVLGTPRESLSLRKSESGPRLLGNKTDTDVTDAIKSYASETLKTCLKEEVSGYIFKSKSPSCGIEGIKVYLPNKMTDTQKAVGIHADVIQKALPALPVEEEMRLNDPWLRENFLMQLFAYDAVQQLQKSALKAGELVEFHTRYKFLLLSKSTKNYTKLGQIVANKQRLEFRACLDSYVMLFKDTVALKSSIKKVVNVLDHMAGFLKKQLDPVEKEELHISIKEFREGVVPLIVPIKLLRVYARKYQETYLQNQVFLQPYPEELGLRSEIRACRDFEGHRKQ